MRDPAGRGRTGARNSWATVSRVPALGLLVVALAGCGPVGGTATVGTGASAAQASAGTGSSQTIVPPASPAPSALSAPKRQLTIAVGGDERVVDLFVPATPAGQQAPLLILLHASGESPFVMANEAGAGALAARAGVIVALPPAKQRRWDAM